MRIMRHFVELQADESAEHIVNGHTRARLYQLQTPDGKPLREGRLCLQLEGAEIEYRDIRIRPLDEPLHTDRGVITLSAVQGQAARPATLRVRNPLDQPLPAVPDAQQTVFPPLASGTTSVSFEPPKEDFSLYLAGPKHVASTDPTQPTAAKIPITARVYPVASLQGRALANACLVGFEEASNGDYQDALFLIENVVVPASQ